MLPWLRHLGLYQPLPDTKLLVCPNLNWHPSCKLKLIFSFPRKSSWVFLVKVAKIWTRGVPGLKACLQRWSKGTWETCYTDINKTAHAECAISYWQAPWALIFMRDHTLLPATKTQQCAWDASAQGSSLKVSTEEFPWGSVTQAALPCTHGHSRLIGRKQVLNMSCYLHGLGRVSLLNLLRKAWY